MKSFYNTTKRTGEELIRAEEEARSQEERVLAFFRSEKGFKSPFEVWHRLFLCSIPITSVRRAMTNLANEGHLEKTDILVTGDYGKPNHLWRLAVRKPEQLKLFE